MKRASRGWILLPVVVVALVAVGFLLSNFQKEAGISKVSKGGVAAAAAAAAARNLASGEGEEAFQAFADAFLVATVARNNAPALNAVDTRLDQTLREILDCLTADREAWQAELEGYWDPESQGVPAYWQTMHPSIQAPTGAALSPDEVRRISVARAAALVDQALALAR
jgi:hypothetical protein